MLLRRITRSFTALGFVASLFMAAPLAAADVTLTTEGPNSGITASASTNTTVTNNNNVSVTNTSTQTATTGNATVSNNTTGGNATTGDATNSNTTTTAVSISNLAGVTGGGGSADV